MKSMRFVGTAAVAIGLVLPLAGSALAADATVNTTGPNSGNSVTIDNSVQVNSTNINVTSVDNENAQLAGTGNVTSADNTSVTGASGSGVAANDNATTTTVSNTNAPAGNDQGVIGDLGTPAPSASCGCSGAGKGGSVLGASTVGGLGGGSAATLPRVGASVPMDVSALRNAWHPQSAAPTTALIKQARGITNVMLGVASLLSLLGGLGSAAYTRRKERRV